ncbi:926_t:CDS:2 [Funneliformis caledonium]|uniref:926_t:CDS:1 n=1 Tax=Funneliformis caledonium TaxID=1117310 RepID=A0A9N8YTI3_9GLOM|nr:926_t:CDS:2 [Funneliformis caledonium]
MQPKDSQRVLELFQSCLTDETSYWIKNKLIVVLNNINIMAAMINALDGILSPALPIGVTGATVILAHNIHTNENWSLAEGCLGP